MINNIRNVAIVGGCGFIGHNLAFNLKKIGHQPFIVDSLAINNILSFTNEEIKNKKLYTSILNNRIELIEKNKVELKIQKFILIRIFLYQFLKIFLKNKLNIFVKNS